MTSPDAPVRVALLGYGVVGSQVARILLDNSEELRARTGRPIELVGIGVASDKPREGAPEDLLTTDSEGLVSREDVDLVVELIGGLEPAGTLIRKAIENGASVVTANKALLAERGGELFEAAEAAGVDLFFEAAVAGAIPIIRPLRESLVGDQVTAVRGIVNGTTNYILDQMHTTRASFADALAEAQRLGFAEADPTADVEGYDAAAKAALLASLAFHTKVDLGEVAREGISQITSEDIAAAEEMRCVIKLLANCTLNEDGSIAVGVHPTMVPLSHPLASVNGAFNAIFVESENAGQLMFMGPGAGGEPTASAVMGDVVTAARNRVRGVAGPGQSHHSELPVADADTVASRHYVSLNVQDEPGVLARVAAIFARHGVSLQAVRQDGVRGAEQAACLGIMTHVAPHAAIRATISELEAMDEVTSSVRVMRVEGV